MPGAACDKLIFADFPCSQSEVGTEKGILRRLVSILKDLEILSAYKESTRQNV
jgi:hypothetical protein